MFDLAIESFNDFSTLIITMIFNDFSEVDKRKGTTKEILDHRLLSTPFSFGARMCLGGRLAELEIKIMVRHPPYILSRIVLLT